jgi:hypothetical protein
MCRNFRFVLGHAPKCTFRCDTGTGPKFEFLLFKRKYSPMYLKAAFTLVPSVRIDVLFLILALFKGAVRISNFILAQRSTLNYFWDSVITEVPR